MPKHDALVSMPLRVLGYRDDAEWAAHCLETDLVGRGRSWKAALSHLMELTEMQVSFALQKNQPALLDHPAHPEIWEMYNRLAREHLSNFQRPGLMPKNRALGALTLPSEPPKGSSAWCGA